MRYLMSTNAASAFKLTKKVQKIAVRIRKFVNSQWRFPIL